MDVHVLKGVGERWEKKQQGWGGGKTKVYSENVP